MSEVITLAGWPPEILAYAMAMYSRSGLSIRESILKITNEKAADFFDKTYFGFGHKSIADNAQIPLAAENYSEIVAFELEDEQLWNGQERSTRYQKFDRPGGYFIPEVVRHTPLEREYCMIADFLLDQYRLYAPLCFEALAKRHPKPEGMKDADYERTLKARAFDVARYWLFNGIITSVGQITSARTLEDQICRLMASEYLEVYNIGQQMKEACQAKPFCPKDKDEPPVAPTLLKHINPNGYLVRIRKLMNRVMAELGPKMSWGANQQNRYVLLAEPFRSIKHEIVAGLVYEASDWNLREIQRVVHNMSAGEVDRIISDVLALRDTHDALPRAFAAGYQIQFDVCIDIGARRDLHRHRNCIQIHQKFTVDRGFDIPELVKEIGKFAHFRDNMHYVSCKINKMKQTMVGNNADYLIPFAFRTPSLYKMDYRQSEYMTVLRSGPQGHFSYRQAVIEMDRQLRELVPGLETYSRVTPLWQENIFKR